MDCINYINGVWRSNSDSTIPIYDAGFLLGDGLFETIRFDNNKLFYPEKHLKRLFAGLDIIRIKLEKSNAEIILLLKAIIEKNTMQSGLLRLMVTRGVVEGPPWKYEGSAGIYITIRSLTPEPEYPVKVVFYPEEKYPIIRFNPAIKSLNYIGNMLAKKDAEKDGAYEPVFYNAEGYVTECAIRNIFFIQGNRLLTPDTNLGVLPGVMRETIISIAKELRETDLWPIPVSVIAKTITKSELIPFVTQFLVPETINSSPSCLAYTFIFEASDPACGSDKENAPSFLPEANGLRYFSFKWSLENFSNK